MTDSDSVSIHPKKHADEHAAEGSDPIPGLFIDAPAYDSGWTSFNLNEVKNLTHDLGGDPDKYLVDVTAKDDTTWGINQVNYGSNTLNDGRNAGYRWYELTATQIKVHRALDDQTAPKLRVRIWRTG